MSNSAALTTTPNPDVFPNSGVCLIEDVLPGVGAFRGSGVIIGPHTILTASHVLWDADSGIGAASAKITVGSTVIGGRVAFHYNKVDDRDDELSRAGSARDFAIIDTARDLSRFGSFDIAADYPGGVVNVSGFPANRGTSEVKTRGSVTAGSVNHVLNYNGFSVAPGYSGGPLWTNQGTGSDPLPAVVGVVSTTRWASQLTAADVKEIERWQAEDADLGTGQATRAADRSSEAQADAAALITGGHAAAFPGSAAGVRDPQTFGSVHTDTGSELFAALAGHDAVSTMLSADTGRLVRHG